MDLENTVDETADGTTSATLDPNRDGTPGTTAAKKDPAESAAAGAGGDTAADDPENDKKKGVQKRIDELTRNWREEQRQNSQLVHALELALQGKHPDQKPGAAVEPGEGLKGKGAAGGKPRPEDFADYDGYVEALSEWKTEQKIARLRAEFSQEKEIKQKNERQTVLAEAVQKGREKFKDFDEVALQQATVTEQMVDIMLATPRLGEIAYYLGQHPEESAKIARMGSVQAALAIGEINALLAAKAAANPQKRVSNAPDPIKPIAGGQDDASSDPDKLPVDEWMKRRHAGKIR